ncbi:DNA methyltransferase, partial [Klebsiella pneumoniae]
GTGALNVGATKIWANGPDGELSPRFPANIVHDGSSEVVSAFPVTPGQQGNISGREKSKPLGGAIYGNGLDRLPALARLDTGSAARFFYSAKADADDRLGFDHPTVKPVDLIRWLIRLVCRKGGTVLDAFAGTGTTGEAAYWEGCNAVLIEREEKFQKDIAKRMGLVLSGPVARLHARTSPDPVESLPLFGDVKADVVSLPEKNVSRKVYGAFAEDSAPTK